MLRVMLLALALTLVACDPVYTAQPVGEKPLNLVADKEQWEGTWVHGEGAVAIAVTDPARGLLKVGWIEPSKDGLKTNLFDVELRTFGKLTFASAKDPDKRDKARYIFGRVEKKERQILIWVPSTDKWKALVKSKQLPGTLSEVKSASGSTSTELLVGPLTAKELGFVTADERAGLFGWDQPTILLKLTK